MVALLAPKGLLSWPCSLPVCPHTVATVTLLSSQCDHGLLDKQQGPGDLPLTTT